MSYAQPSKLFPTVVVPTSANEAQVVPAELHFDGAALHRGRSLSCIIPCYNEAGNLDALLEALRQKLMATGLVWEVIVVDDGSRDGTAVVAEKWCALPGFRCLVLSRNFGKEAALSAGLKAARGDAVILLDGDLQHSPDLIDTMLHHWRRGAEVAYAVREQRDDEHIAKRWGSRLFYKMLSSSNRFAIPKNAGDFRLMDRKVVNALLALPERSRFMKGLYAWVGFQAVAIPYMPAPRLHGSTKFSPLHLLGLAVDGLTSFTTWPLRMVSFIGLALAIPAFTYGAFLVADHFLEGDAVSGWTTIMVSLMFFIGVQMISLGIVGEYVARIFEEVKGRPLYVVKSDIGQGLEGEAL